MVSNATRILDQAAGIVTALVAEAAAKAAEADLAAELASVHTGGGRHPNNLL